MATVAPKNYLSLTDEFLAHWPQVNAGLPAPLALNGPYEVADLTDSRAALAAQIVAVEAAINANQGAIADRDTRRATVRERMRQFNQLVRGAFPGSTYQRMLPKMPGIGAAPGLWMKAMADMHNVWTQINAINPIPVGSPIPLILSGNYTLATFTGDQTGLNAAFTEIETTENEAMTAIRKRDSLWAAVYERLKQYRLSVQGSFAAGAPLLLSLPALTPAGGHTPDAVNVSALWDAVLQKAVVTYTASADPDLAEYELRGSAGGTSYNSDTASVLGSHMVGDLTPFQTDAGLVASGSKMFYKVFVVLTMGNEKGSRTVSVTRP